MDAGQIALGIIIVSAILVLGGLFLYIGSSFYYDHR